MRRIAPRLLAAGMAAAVGYVLIVAPSSTGGVRHRTRSGGFSIELAGGWNVRTRTDGGVVWLEGERTNRLGLDLSWMWVARWNAGGDDTLALSERAVRADIRRLWGNTRVTATKATIGGAPARKLRYSRPPRQLRPIRRATFVDEVRYVVRSGDQVYEVGFGGWFRVPREADELDQRLDLSTPRGTRMLTVDLPADELSLSVPARWNTNPTAVRGDVAMLAAEPPHPSRAWVIVWAYDEPVQASVEASLREAARRGDVLASDEVELGGRAATRIDFAHSIDYAPNANFATWIFETTTGRSAQLLVGAVDGVSVDADAVARKVRFGGGRATSGRD